SGAGGADAVPGRAAGQQAERSGWQGDDVDGGGERCRCDSRCRAVVAEAVQRCIRPEQQRTIRRRVLLPDPHHRGCAIRLRRQRPEDSAVRGGWRWSGTGWNRLVENDGGRRVARRIPDREPELVGAGRVAKEPDGTRFSAGPWLVGVLCDPRTKPGADGADVDGDILDARKTVIPGPVNAQGAARRRIDPECRGRRVDVI